MNSPSLFQARTLMAHGQYREAAAELTRGLSQDPEDPYLLAALATCQSELGDNKTALQNARKAMGFSGDDNYARGVVCRILLDTDKPKEAERLAAEGLALDPEDEELLALRGIALFNLRRYKESLACAQLALEMDPENESAHWLQTQCKSVLRQGDAVGSSLEHLAHNPQGIAMQSHAFMLLRQGRTKEAYGTFLQALKNDPNDQSAREGLKEAIRGRFILYRWLQAYDYWCQSLGRYWYVPFLAVVIGRRVVATMVEENPALAPYLIPIGVVLVFLIWGHAILGPVLNALLLGHPYGRYALNNSEKWIGRYWMLAAAGLLVAGVLALFGNSSLAAGFAIYGVALWVLQGLASFFRDEKVRLGFSHGLAGIVNLAAILVAVLPLSSSSSQ